MGLFTSDIIFVASGSLTPSKSSKFDPFLTHGYLVQGSPKHYARIIYYYIMVTVTMMCSYMCYFQLVSKRILDANIINIMIINKYIYTHW